MGHLTEAAKKLYIYAFPLIVTEGTHRGADDKGFEHFRKFPDDREKRIVKLNMDTLYSLAWTQLANTPYLVHIPVIRERYYLFPVMDAYTNVVATFGTRTPEHAAGDYLLLLEGDPVPAGYEGYEIIRLPDSLNSILLRIETRGSEDYPLVNRLQDSITIRPLYPERVQPVPAADGRTPSAFAEELDARDYFTLFAELAAHNPIRDPEYLNYAAALGITPGFDWDALTPEQQKALEQGRREALALVVKNGRNPAYFKQKNGWTAILGGVGSYGTDYLQRAQTAYSGWGANLIADSAYVTTYTDHDGGLLTNQHSYRLHIAPDGYPHAAVFWSLTLYGEPSRYPVPNPIDRFSVNTYDVESGRIKQNPDGSLDIFISAAAPAGETANWLPAPQEEEHFSLAIRIYWPDEQTIGGNWDPPTLERI